MWTNWSGSVRCRPTEVARPRSESEIVDLLRRAATYRERVRPIGAGHSFTPLAKSDGVMVSLDRVKGAVRIDPDLGSATFRAGTRVSDLGAPLSAVGLALENQGDVDVQSLAGATATGTHGTGKTLASMSSQVQSLRLVLASGDVLECDAQSDDLLAAAGLSLGVLGIVTEMTLRVVPAYRLHERTWRESVDDALESLPALIEEHRHLEFFWWPHRDRIELKALQPTDAPVDDLPDSKWERIDESWRVFPTARDAKFNEIEYAVPLEDGPECFRLVRGVVRSKHRNLMWPVEYRTMAAERYWLSPAFQRPSACISVHQDARQPFRELFADVEAVFRDFGGRPHWGKLHTLTAADLARLYPRWPDFIAVRDRLDPDSRFSNDYVDKILGS